MTECIVMFGDKIDGPGGISSVVRTFQDAGFLKERRVVYISSYEGANMARQVIVMFRAILVFLKLQRTHGVSLVHIHTASRGSFWRAALFGELARISGLPYLIHIHSGEFLIFFNDECGRWKKAVVTRILSNAVSVLCLTHGWKKLLNQIVPTANYSVLPNPISLEHIAPSSVTTKRNQLLFLGRLTEKKGVFDLLRAIPTVLLKYPDVQLILGGGGSNAQACQLIDKLGLTQVVFFAGCVDGQLKDQYLREAEIVVIPSHYEAFGMVILEAMAHSKPVVATNVGGIPEVLTEGIHGTLVKPHDHFALAHALISLLADKSRAIQMGLAGYKHVHTYFSVDRVMRLLGSHYDMLISNRNQHVSEKK